MRRAIGLPVALAWGVQRVIRDAVTTPRPRPVVVHGEAPPVPAGRELTAVCWNLQYCAGRSGSFFYEGGTRVRATAREVSDTLADVIAALRAIDADVVMLQEVDLDSDRTGRIDQLAAIRAALALPTWTSTPYHRVPYVPVPVAHPMGRVDTHLATLSRFRITSATRVPLSPLREGRFRRAFNLRRALLTARIAGEPGEVALMNTHLSAFSAGDGTLARQVAEVDAECRDQRVPFVLAGDFNALPPGDDPMRLAPIFRAEYADESPPLAPLYARWRPGIEPADCLADVGRFGTYVPIGETAPDRTIDHVFYSGVEKRAFEVIGGLGHVSDHLPIVFRFGL